MNASEQPASNPLEDALGNMPSTQSQAFRSLLESYPQSGLQGLVTEILDSRHSIDDAIGNLDQINSREWNKGHDGAMQSGMIMFATPDFSRRFQLKWSKTGQFSKPSISVSYSRDQIK